MLSCLCQICNSLFSLLIVHCVCRQLMVKSDVSTIRSCPFVPVFSSMHCLFVPLQRIVILFHNSQYFVPFYRHSQYPVLLYRYFQRNVICVPLVVLFYKENATTILFSSYLLQQHVFLMASSLLILHDNISDVSRPAERGR